MVTNSFKKKSFKKSKKSMEIIGCDGIDSKINRVDRNKKPTKKF